VLGVTSLTTNPTLKEFLECVRSEYHFLVERHGFFEPDPLENGNPFGVQYQRSDMRISIEGTNWGFGVQILLTPIEQGELVLRDMVPLWAIHQIAASNSTQRVLGSQLDQIRSYARFIQDRGSEGLAGNSELMARARGLVKTAGDDDDDA